MAADPNADVEGMDRTELERERTVQLRQQTKDIRTLVYITAAHAGTTVLPTVVHAVQQGAPTVVIAFWRWLGA